MTDTRTIVYRYGLLPPTAGADLIAEQISLAHRYQNTLIEIERDRRARARVILGEQTAVAAAQAVVDTLVAEFEAFTASLKIRKAETRRAKLTPQESMRSVELRDRLKQARAELKTAKQTQADDPAIRAQLSAITTDSQERVRAARAASGLYWGTYLIVEQAMDAARKSPTDPRFQRWTGDGAVAVQIQGGMTAEDLRSDTRLQLDATPQPVPWRSGKPRPRVRLRIGSTEDRAPVWGEWPVILHRPLPADARIKWAKVLRQRVAGRDHWSLHLTLETARLTEACGAGTVAVDLRWYRDGDHLIAGTWTDGTTEQRIEHPREVRGEIEKVEDLRSIRDKSMNALRSQLMDWRDVQTVLPDAHAERLQWLHAWRSPARFAALAVWWRDHRLQGDDAISAALETWRQQDKHLWLWETHARRGALARRRDTYRVLAAQLARRYQTLVIERLNLRSVAQIPAVDSEEPNVPRGRSQRTETAPSELRAALVQAFQARGGQVVTVPPTGPAMTLLRQYREQRDVEEMPGTARVSRFSRLRAKRAAREAATTAVDGTARMT